MEIKGLLVLLIRPYSIGHILICGIGIFSILGQLEGRHHEVGNTQTHQLGQKLSQSSSVTKDDGMYMNFN